ncbi:MAG TPA: hypothetical protein VG755_19875, partial [Nannocystaceae bacterium]|nr:hypothetical protein [Nannocystaceae bacterium]
YEMIGGRAPFESASPRELLNMQCTLAPPPWPDDVKSGVPRGIERLVMQLLEKRPDARPADADAVLAVLDDFRSEGAPSGRTLAGTPPPTRTGATEVPALQPVAATRPRDSTPRIADTIGLVERAAGPRTLGTPWAVALIVGLSLVAGGVTWWLRAQSPTPTTTTQSRP